MDLLILHTDSINTVYNIDREAHEPSLQPCIGSENHVCAWKNAMQAGEHGVGKPKGELRSIHFVYAGEGTNSNKEDA